MQHEPRVVALGEEAAVDVVVAPGSMNFGPPMNESPKGLSRLPSTSRYGPSTPPSLTSMNEPTLREWSPMHATRYQVSRK